MFAHEGFVKACPVGWIPTISIYILEKGISIPSHPPVLSSLLFVVHVHLVRGALFFFFCFPLLHSFLKPFGCARGRERERMNEWMNKLYFTRVVEKTRGLFTSSPRPWGKLLLTKDTVSYSVLSTCTFIQFMLKWTPANRETSRQWALKNKKIKK